MPDLIALERMAAEWRTGNRVDVRAQAIAYVQRFRAEFAPLEGLSLEECVHLVEGYRDAGREHDRMAADAWILAQYPPQYIVGVGTPGFVANDVMALMQTEALSRAPAGYMVTIPQ